MLHNLQLINNYSCAMMLYQIAIYPNLIELNCVESIQLISCFYLQLQRSKRSFDNFDPEFTGEAARLTPIDRNFIQNIDHRVFDGFSYVNPVMNSMSK